MVTHYIVENMSVMFLMTTHECSGTVMMIISLKLVIYQKGFILERVNFKKVMSVSKDVLFVLYMLTNHLTKYSHNIFQELTDISKINHMKKVIQDMNVFRKECRVRQEVSDDIKPSISFIKDELQTSIKNNMYYGEREEK